VNGARDLYPRLKDAAWLRRRYVDAGLSTGRIAGEVGCSAQAVRMALAAAGIARRQPRTRRRYPSWPTRIGCGDPLDEDASAVTIATRVGVHRRDGARRPSPPPASTGTVENAAVDATRGWPTGLAAAAPRPRWRPRRRHRRRAGMRSLHGAGRSQSSRHPPAGMGQRPAPAGRPRVAAPALPAGRRQHGRSPWNWAATPGRSGAPSGRLTSPSRPATGPGTSSYATTNGYTAGTARTALSPSRPSVECRQQSQAPLSDC
jgi:hypothetical protein